MTAMAPATSSQRKCRLPCFEIVPSRSLPPVECCLGTKPIHAARLRPRRELFPISHLSRQRGGNDRTDAGDFFQPPAFLTRAMPGMDTLLDGHDFCPDGRVLASKDAEAEPRSRWNAIILLVGNNLEQLCRAIPTFRRDDAELGHMPAESFADQPEAAGRDATSSRTAALRTWSPRTASTAA